MTNPHSIPQQSPGGQETPEAALRKIDIFSDLSDDQLHWFVSSAKEIKLSAGDVVIREGDPADALFVLLEGEVRGRRENGGGNAPGLVAQAGQSRWKPPTGVEAEAPQRHSERASRSGISSRARCALPWWCPPKRLRQPSYSGASFPGFCAYRHCGSISLCLLAFR